MSQLAGEIARYRAQRLGQVTDAAGTLGLRPPLPRALVSAEPVLLVLARPSLVGWRMDPNSPVRVTCRALVVDDDVLSRHLLSDALRARGFDVADVTSAAEGLHALADPRRYSLIVSDLRMPELDGEAFVREVRAARNTSIPPPIVIIVTGDVTSRLERALQDAGADAVLSKRLGAPLIAAAAQMLVGSVLPPVHHDGAAA